MCDAKLVRAVNCQILRKALSFKNSRSAPAARASTNVPRTKVTAPQDHTTQGSIEQSHHFAAVAEFGNAHGDGTYIYIYREIFNLTFFFLPFSLHRLSSPARRSLYTACLVCSSVLSLVFTCSLLLGPFTSISMHLSHVPFLAEMSSLSLVLSSQALGLPPPFLLTPSFLLLPCLADRILAFPWITQRH